MRFVKISKKEFIAYFLVGVIFLISFSITAVFYNKIYEKTFDVAKAVTEKASFGIGSGYATIEAFNSSQEEIALSILESKKEVEKVLEDNNLPVVRDFTSEEEEEIMQGNISAEDAIEILMSKNPATDSAINVSQNDGGVAKSGASDNHIKNNADNPIGEKITKLYGLKAYYLGLLGNLFSQAKQEYNAVKDSDANLKSVASKYISKAASLESECDSKVYGMLAELESELKKTGGDISVISTIEQAYIKEKRLKKSYYLTKYKF